MGKGPPISFFNRISLYVLKCTRTMEIFFFLDNRKIKSQPQTRINKKERQFHRQRSHPVSKKRPRNRFFYHPTDELN